MRMQVIGARAGLVHIAQAVDSAFAGHSTALLFFVMIMCPLLMNLLQARTHTCNPNAQRQCRLAGADALLWGL